MLLPTAKEEVQWELVLKSQITSALLEHLAIPAESYVSINTKPPVVDQISSEKPNITMLKLMIAADNSAQGAGEVFQAIVDQSNLTMSDFASRIQLIDGDLATCSNLTTLQTQQTPSKHKEESLMNVLTMLGGAHTLWNISQAIYSKHVGDKSDSRDAGAWRFLDGLGIPSNNMLDKKYFTLMIRNIEKIQRATLVYCLMLVMGIQDKHLTKELPKISSLRIKQIVDETYKRFFSIEAKRNATIHTSLKLSNLLLRLSDFATVVEGNSAMKSGDIGRLMNVWKRWSVIAQGIKKLTQYSIQLPRMIILLNEILPPGLGKVIKHSMFVAPSGKQKHFVAKDHYLENQNYWLKHFFNNSGRGTNIDRLKSIYSPNVPLLRDLTCGLLSDCGKETIAQSHYNQINLVSLNNCMRMCRQNDISYIATKLDQHIPKKTEDFYATGIQKMKKLFVRKGKPLNKLRPPPMKKWNSEITDQLVPEQIDSDVSSEGDSEPSEEDSGDNGGSGDDENDGRDEENNSGSES
ncbi:hypothetical protein PGTUg99_021912 [Puccinia graminis f. sp. tritici]|uniref:DUF6589 domain-containing protein n=2 Tax=Puccinia graminis f. sp. tritici TaxID=56615 RepID=A0A5B0RP01_PUCGR|nr:hypothetical protein PGTUg99_021912 [Puccinia graminis f. sp. tritici]